jgi:uncharacterized caspase-like protein
MAFARLFASIVILLLSSSVFAEEAKNRVALVIGNSAYRHSPLPNATSDAKLMAEKLKAAGFEVSAFYDTNQRKMKHELLDFADIMRERGKDVTAFVFYAGHAVQMNGENYLIPVDEQIENERDVFVDGLGLSAIMNVLQTTEAHASIVVLDACRDNPFSFAHGAGGGLAKVDATSGSLIAFSALPGTVAPASPAGSSSAYTAALAQAITERGLKIEDVFKKVHATVSEKTHGAQTPWEAASLSGDIFPAGTQ